MKTENAILAGLGVAIAGFFGYRYYKRKKDEKEAAIEAEKAAKAAQAAPPPSGGVTTQPVGYSDYQKKVMKLQTILGVAVDGNPKDQTNGKVKEWYPNLYKTLGNVSPSNIDQYLAAKRETTSTSSAARVQEIWDAMGSGTPATVRIDTTVTGFYFDSSSNNYKSTGGYFIVLRGTKIYKSKAVKVQGGFIADLPVYGTQTKNAIGTRKVFIGPANLYV
jgi:hypothetical protein